MAAPPFRPILLDLQSPTYNLTKCLVPILNPLTQNEYTVKDSFQFAEEICEQDPTLTMGSLDVDLLFTNIPLDETIDICVNQLFENAHSCHINMSFSMETEKENKLSFLDVEVICEQGKFTTTVYRKPTFSGVFSNFESFLPSIYKFGMVYTLVYRCFRICSNWTQFHTELI